MPIGKKISKSKVPKNVTQLKNKRFILTVGLSKKVVEEKTINYRVYGAKQLQIEDHTLPLTSQHQVPIELPSEEPPQRKLKSK